MTGPIEVFDDLREDLFRYYETPFRLRSESIARERRALLDADGVAYREPWIEPIPEYERAASDLATSFVQLGANGDLSDFVKLGLFDSGLFTLEYQDGRVVVKTSPALRHLDLTPSSRAARLPLADGLQVEMPKQHTQWPSHEYLLYHAKCIFRSS